MIIRFRNKTNLRRALQLCEQFNYRWRAGQKPTDYCDDVAMYFERHNFVYLEINDKIITFNFGNGISDRWDRYYEQSITAGAFFNSFKKQNGVYILN